MQNRLLFPHSFRNIGFLVFPAAAAWLLSFYVFNKSIFPFLEFKNGIVDRTNNFGPDFIFTKGFTCDFNGELSLLLTLMSLFMIAFAREKKEDEYVRTVRLHALQTSLYINYALLAIASILIYGFSFLWVMYSALFSMLIIFIAIYYYQLHLRPRLAKNS
jgi:hypothetical protein